MPDEWRRAWKGGAIDIGELLWRGIMSRGMKTRLFLGLA